MLSDSEQRKQATNPHCSFIVQAPAGSGKTEILTQRYLRLLSTVTAPEQIIALTFTRKAASEMRERILLALKNAKQNIPANSPHQQITFTFAHAALTRDYQYQWNILEQPNRLRIITIDSLCQSINQAIPLLEKQISYSQITDKADNYYLNASRQCIQLALNTAEYQQAIKILLLHVDNRHDRLLDLFTALLSQRDQWLTLLFQARTQEKSHFEYALQFIEQHELNCFKQSLPASIAEELVQCARELACIENNPDSPRYALQQWFEFKQINQCMAKALSKLLLTNDDHCRKSFDHHVGLLSSSCPPETYKKLKNASKELLAKLNEYPEFLSALKQVSNLPHPEYELEQWEVLQALFLLLPVLVSHLHILFSEHNEIDFTAISQQALAALGDEENPTDLALYLDNAIHHILVDEFQDTSITQFELLTKLVMGWHPHDGKTLFIVGDPMQSIYRFRQAEVGLFFRAKKQGIGPIALHALELSCNFRSTQCIVDWVNKQFASIFPKQIDMESGAVPFHPSIHSRKDNEHSTIQAIQCQSREEEAHHLVQIIQYELKYHPEQSIAILVRSRTQLHEIIPLLRYYQIPYQGTDITLLANLTHLRDVWSLTQALLFPANRLAWLAVLHSPYCGLSLSDIHLIANFNKKKSIYFALLHLGVIAELSEEGRIRAEFFIHIMHQSLVQRHTTNLSSWIIHTLKNLHVDAILNANQWEDLNQFWILLDRYEQGGHLVNLKEFLTELNTLYAPATPAPLQIMTIHKSKGLEFDTVLLPSLGAQANRGDNPLIRWLKVPTQKQGDLLLMSPIRAAHQEDCPLYDYLSRLDDVKTNYEIQRLLYVAVTRAKSRLYLLDHTEKPVKNSFRSLLKQQEFSAKESLIQTEEKQQALPKLVRLPLEYYLNPFKKQNGIANPHGFLPPLASNNSRLIGIITHQLLQWICDNHPITFAEVPWNLVLYELKKLGLNKLMQQEALLSIKEQISRLFQDQIGSWIIAPHQQEHNEYELLVNVQGRTLTRIIDRTFIEQEKQWIIDFKTGNEEEASLIKHQQQLNDYGIYLSHLTPLPIHCGVYYLATNRWISWQYEASKQLDSI